MKPGSLAVVVNSLGDNNGVVVRCKKRLSSRTWTCPDGNVNIEQGWKFWPALIGVDGLLCDTAPDSQLMELRGFALVLGVK